ncbi:Cobalt-precorrin-8 methylmutase [bioreactor metagenome]|uniref:Cobalt-precorrin-8 methylmutase n=1 Tax=bioreactor metagenome TaxID=1076179 RepID=A0A645DGX5_9ZZZZ|nr:precorrin-8X methylmutase [Candidatus Metalachnospira sp.]
MKLDYIKPDEIEKRSMEIISSEMPHDVPDELADTIKRVVHTTADFDYVDNLCFSENVIELALKAIRNGATIVTDTNMARAGINKAAIEKCGCKAVCYMADTDVAEASLKRGVTRAVISMEKASQLDGNVIFAIGNAPTALIELNRLIKHGKISPALIIGVPVGFVNVVEAKELIMESNCPYIVARGRKGGSNVAAAIVNSLLYKISR